MLKIYDNAKIQIFNQFKSPVINVVIDKLPKENWEYYVLANGYLYRVSEIVSSDFVNDFKKIEFYYIISGKFILPNVKKAKPHSIIPLKNFGAYPIIDHIMIYNGDNFNVKIKKYYKINPNNKLVSGAFVAQYMSDNTPLVNVEGATPDKLMENLHLSISKKNINITKTKILESLKSFYHNPIMVWCAFKDKYTTDDLPTYNNIMQDYDNIKVSMEDMFKNNFSVEKIEILLNIPPLYIETYRALMCNIETTVFPEMRLRNCVIVRNTKGSDETYTKLLDKMVAVEKTDEKTGKKYIITTYGDIMDIGEFLKLGESNELSERLRWLV